MKTMWHYVMKQKSMLVLNLVCAFGFVIIELGLPTLLAKMLDQGVAKNDFDYVKQIGLIMIATILVGIVLYLGLAVVGARLNTRLVRDMRTDMMDSIQDLSHQEYEKLGISSLITRITNDAYQVMLFMGMILRIGFITPIMFIFSLFMIVRTSPSLTYFVLGALPFLLGGIILIGKKSGPLSSKQQSNLDNINMILRENLTGLRVIRAFVNEKFEEKRFDKVNTDYSESSKKLFKLMAVAQPAFFFLFNIVIVLVIWFGIVQIDNSQLEIGNLIAFIEYIFHALFSFMLFSTVFMMYPRAAVSAGRIQEVLDIEPAIKDGTMEIDEAATNGVLEFNNVCFAYPGESESPVIRDISFTANPGETVAFIGSTGSGKSTLVQLIPRFYDVTRGEIKIDGFDVRDYPLKTLREKIGYIPQKALLFSGTIAENLKYGKSDATEAEMLEALDIAQATEFISQKELGLEEPISEGGSNFSGGQKQRLAIARALIRKPAIYVFDDSFSALDYKTDATLRKRLKKETTQSTVLIVAQRVSTIMHADKIIVLNEGNVVGTGTHRELLQSCSIYYDIASSQLTEEELA
ncbi:ABC transporter ATP-binding protein [Vagococcus silagei]|uniref:ABC transporter ATP-binding protein n=1 Tax=Vagococcus silagei TaxID=2508885 RepID=A0A4S3B009_9ENTE|nr:ABC transporter ATP-binding protein [Vagococcus silagei]THB60341.1 ABC transporter ATP-binding protein [Vagococcus silagei]